MKLQITDPDKPKPILHKWDDIPAGSVIRSYWNTAGHPLLPRRGTSCYQIKLMGILPMSNGKPRHIAFDLEYILGNRKTICWQAYPEAFLWEIVPSTLMLEPKT